MRLLSLPNLPLALLHVTLRPKTPQPQYESQQQPTIYQPPHRYSTRSRWPLSLFSKPGKRDIRTRVHQTSLASLFHGMEKPTRCPGNIRYREYPSNFSLLPVFSFLSLQHSCGHSFRHTRLMDISMSFCYHIAFLFFGPLMIRCIFFLGCLYQVHRYAELVVVKNVSIRRLRNHNPIRSPRICVDVAGSVSAVRVNLPRGCDRPYRSCSSSPMKP